MKQIMIFKLQNLKRSFVVCFLGLLKWRRLKTNEIKIVFFYGYEEGLYVHRSPENKFI